MQQTLRALEPIIAAGKRAHHAEDAIQSAPARLAPGGALRDYQRLRLQLFQAIAQRILAGLREFGGAPEEHRQRHARNQEKEQVDHTRMLAILRITRMPTISEMIA